MRFLNAGPVAPSGVISAIFWLPSSSSESASSFSVPVSELSTRTVSMPCSRSFSNWSRISAISGETTTVSPGSSRLGSW